MDTIDTASRVIKAPAYPNPFTLDRTDYEFPPGLNIRQMLDVIKLPTWVPFLVLVNEEPIHPSRYDAVYPRIGDRVVFRAVPTGGGGEGGKDPLRMILSIVVMIVAVVAQQYQLLPLIGGMNISGAVVMTVGMLAVNMLCPPPKAANLNPAENIKDSPTYALSASQNPFKPYGCIPMLLGKHRITPPFAAQPYTENVGDDQYLRELFLLGYGPMAIEQLKNGETPLTSYHDIQIEIIDGSLQTQNPTLYPGDMFQSNQQVHLTAASGWHQLTTQPDCYQISVDITFPQGLATFDQQTGAKSVRSVSVELQAAVAGSGNWFGAITGKGIGDQFAIFDGIVGLLVIDKLFGVASYLPGTKDAAGNPLFPPCPSWAWPIAQVYNTAELTYDEYGFLTIDPADITCIDVRPANISPYGFAPSIGTFPGVVPIVCLVASGTLYNDIFTVSAATTSAVRRTFYCPVPATGQYDVRLRRVTADSVNDSYIDNVYWTALRSYQTGLPINEPYTAKVALRIKGTDQLNGALDQFNLVGQTICPDYDSGTGTWPWRPTSNPASLYRYALQCRANSEPLTDAQIDLVKLAAWHTYCATNGFEFNHYFDYVTDLQDVLQMIAAAGRASKAYVNGKESVVFDDAQANYAAYFSPRNSWGYRYNKSFNEPPHAFKVKFWNRDAGWHEDERPVYDDGYSEANATRFEDLNLPGITSADLAWRHGRYHIATARLQPETHSFYTDFESLTCTRGDKILFVHDVIMAGIGSARIKSYTDDGVYDVDGSVITPPTQVLTITVDDLWPMEAGQTYGVVLRQHDGTALIKTLTTVAGYASTFSPASTWLIEDVPDIGALVLYGLEGEEGMDLIITQIDPINDLSAKITCLPYAPGVRTADTGPIPAFDTHITIPPDRWSIYVPVISSVRSDETVMIVGPTGELIPQILITFLSQNLPVGLIERVQVRYRRTGTDNPYLYVESTMIGEVMLSEDVQEGISYTFDARYFLDGKWSKWCASRQETVVGATSVPDDVTGFKVSTLGDILTLTWDAVTKIDLKGYNIRYSPETTGVVWTAAVPVGPMIPKPTTTTTLPNLNGTYLIKAVDYGDRESANAVAVINTTAAITAMNVVEAVTENPTFAGTKTDVILLASELMLDYADDYYDRADFYDVDDFYLGEGGFASVGYYYFNTPVDLGEVFVSRLSGNLSARGVNYGNDIYRRVDWYEVDDFYGVSDSQWRAKIQFRMTNDDPAGTPTWTDWADFAYGDYTSRAFEFRVKMESLAWGITPVVSALSVSIDMPDRFISGNDLTVPVEGLRIDFSPAFKGLKGVGTNDQNMATGDYHVITNKSATGFDIAYKDSTGAAVERTFDYVAAGYGRVIT